MFFKSKVFQHCGLTVLCVISAFFIFVISIVQKLEPLLIKHHIFCGALKDLINIKLKVCCVLYIVYRTLMKILMSSAKQDTILYSSLYLRLYLIRGWGKSIGGSTAPWRINLFTADDLDFTLFTITLWVLFIRKLKIHLPTLPVIHYVHILCTIALVTFVKSFCKICVQYITSAFC